MGRPPLAHNGSCAYRREPRLPGQGGGLPSKSFDVLCWFCAQGGHVLGREIQQPQELGIGRTVIPGVDRLTRNTRVPTLQSTAVAPGSMNMEVDPVSQHRVIILIFLLVLPGCSLVFVDGPPQVRLGAEAPPVSPCTSSMTLPNWDLAAGALSGALGIFLFIDNEQGFVLSSRDVAPCSYPELSGWAQGSGGAARSTAAVISSPRPYRLLDRLRHEAGSSPAQS